MKKYKKMNLITFSSIHLAMKYLKMVVKMKVSGRKAKYLDKEHTDGRAEAFMKVS